MLGYMDCPRCSRNGRQLDPCSACGGVGYVNDDWLDLSSND